MQYFESSSQKKRALKVYIFDLPSTKWCPCKIFVKLNGNHLLVTDILKLHKYQTFDLMKMHNMSKIWFPNNKFNLLRWNRILFMVFQGLSVARSCRRTETVSLTAPLTLTLFKRGILCNFAKTFRGRHFMGHSGTDLKFSITIEF